MRAGNFMKEREIVRRTHPFFVLVRRFRPSSVLPHLSFVLRSLLRAVQTSKVRLGSPLATWHKICRLEARPLRLLVGPSFFLTYVCLSAPFKTWTQLEGLNFKTCNLWLCSPPSTAVLLLQPLVCAEKLECCIVSI